MSGSGFKVEDASRRTVAQTIEEILADTYGISNVYRTTVNGFIRIGSRTHDDRYEVHDRGSGVFVDTSRAMENTLGKVRRDVQGTRTGPSQHDSGDPNEYDERGYVNDDKSIGGGNSLISVNNDGSVTFMPPFTKEEAGYGDGGVATPAKCKDCAHFIEGGGCHFVQGEIDPEDVCEQFYADYGVYGDNDTDVGLSNPVNVWGEKFDWSENDIEDFVRRVRESLEDRR